jgi:hypothetical protein
LALALAAGACGGDDTPGQADAATQPDASMPPAARGHEGSGFVAGGVKSQSQNYKLVGTVTSGDGTSSSPNHQQRGGVVGSTQAP